MQNKILLILLFLTACNVITPTPAADTGIEGRVTIGPVCPVVQQGTDCADKPYQAALTVLSPDGRKIVQFQTDENGQFKIPLAPGDYVIHPESPNALPYAQDQTFNVQAGRFTEITIIYDSGIR